MDFALEDNLDVINITMILFFEGGDFPLENDVLHIVEEEEEEHVQATRLYEYFYGARIHARVSSQKLALPVANRHIRNVQNRFRKTLLEQVAFENSSSGAGHALTVYCRVLYLRETGNPSFGLKYLNEGNQDCP